VTNEPKDLQPTAYHEAGHATVALALGRDIQRVSILPNQHWLGRCELKKGARRGSKDPREDDALILLGGLAAEAKFTSRYAWGAAAHDLRAVQSLMGTRAAVSVRWSA
jgi:ATP-dependent Zn protease